MLRFAKLLLFCLVIIDQATYAKTSANGRRLQPGHWLTCSSGEDHRVRRDPPFHRNTPEDVVSPYKPEFTGEYGFEVRDTWQELVTHYAASCLECGETCAGEGQKRQCTCKTCAWQELETFTQHWSMQKVTWQVSWRQDVHYRQKRREWLSAGQPMVSRTPHDLPELFIFDPERPIEYFLFPGESEKFSVGHRGPSSEISVGVEFASSQHDYEIEFSEGSRFSCDDRDVKVSAAIKTLRRRVTRSPNSIEFHAGWLVPVETAGETSGEVKSDGERPRIAGEPGEIQLTDLSAQRYEEQNIFDHYKQSRVAVYLVEIKRFLWLFNTQISRRTLLNDNISFLRWHDEENGTPPVGVFTLPGADLLRTRFLSAPFHLRPEQSYKVCAKVLRQNNIYYQTKAWGFELWSEPNCAFFTYAPEHDLRPWGRITRDSLARFIGFGIL